MSVFFDLTNFLFSSPIMEYLGWHQRFAQFPTFRHSTQKYVSQRRLQQQRDPILVDDHTSTHGNNGRKTTPFNDLSDGCNFDYSHGSWATTNGHPFHECLSSFIESFLGISFISIALSGVLFLISRCAICIAGFLMIFCTGRSRFLTIGKL